MYKFKQYNKTQIYYSHRRFSFPRAHFSRHVCFLIALSQLPGVKLSRVNCHKWRYSRTSIDLVWKISRYDSKFNKRIPHMIVLKKEPITNDFDRNQGRQHSFIWGGECIWLDTPSPLPNFLENIFFFPNFLKMYNEKNFFSIEGCILVRGLKK